MVIIYKYIAILYKFIFNTFFSFNLHLMFLWLVLGFYRIFSGSGVDNSHKIQYDLRPSIKDLLRFFYFLSILSNVHFFFWWVYTGWFIICCVMLTLPDFFLLYISLPPGIYGRGLICAPEAWRTRWSNTLHCPIHKFNAIESHVHCTISWTRKDKLLLAKILNERYGGQTMLLKAIFNCIPPFSVDSCSD